jgi:hypothetical protein
LENKLESEAPSTIWKRKEYLPLMTPKNSS